MLFVVFLVAHEIRDENIIMYVGLIFAIAVFITVVIIIIVLLRRKTRRQGNYNYICPLCMQQAYLAINFLDSHDTFRHLMGRSV